MPIPLDEPRTGGHPVIKRQRLNEHFIGALVKTLPRNILKEGKEVLRPNGKPSQELVLTLVTMPGTTAEAGLAGDQAVPAPGDLVRLILRGGAFGEWIELRKTHGTLNVGDIVTQTTEYAQAYDADGKKIGGRITDQATLDRVPRSQAVGVYGPLTLRQPTPAEAEWVAKAEAAYMHERERLSAEVTNGSWGSDQEPF